MSGVSERDRDVAGTTVRVPLPVAGGARNGRRWVAVAAVGAATVLMFGIGWSIAGDSDGTAEAGTTGPASSPGAPATPDPGASDGSGQEGAGNDPPEGSGPGNSGPSGEGAGAGGAGDKPAPGNRAPVIESPGLSSDGLLLRFDPTVTDPDGDDVELLFQVFSTTVDPTQVCFSEPLCKGDALPDGTRASYRFNVDQVGYRYEAEVTVIAIDDRGATTRETFTHTVEAVSQVTISDVRFRLARSADCFEDVSPRSMVGLVKLTGPVDAGRSFSIEMSPNMTSFVLPVGGSGEVVGEKPVQTVRVAVEFAGGTADFRKSHRGDANQGFALYGAANPCAGHFTYRIGVDVR